MKKKDKLLNQHKFRLYLIKEIECAIFSIFFDASTIPTCSYGQQSNNNASKSLAEVQTTLNCFSLIVPLVNKAILFDHYGDNTNFFVNCFDNMILEFKVFAHIKPKVLNNFRSSHLIVYFIKFYLIKKKKIKNVTAAIQNLTQSIQTFCSTLNTIRTRGIYPVDLELKSLYKINVLFHEKGKFLQHDLNKV